MKRFFVAAVLAFAIVGCADVYAQKAFKGIVKYQLSSSGANAVQLQADQANFELKVMGDKVYADAKASIFLTRSPLIKDVLVSDLTVSHCFDFSMLLAYLSSQGVELTSYQGDGKIVQKHTYTQQDVDSLTIPVTEGFYMEYVDGQTKKIAGMDCKLVKRHMFDGEGVDHPLDVWYTDEMGPKNNFLFFGVKGMPMEYVMDLGEGKAVTISASEVIKGKVKEVDFLLPAGYSTIDEETMKAFGEELQEEMQYLGGDDE
ncbi:MAG: hypothetical protein IJV22_09135 [Bacteroidales bacterium]|nr:hypothetical protein [Bacteroidales bacterium]